MMIGTGTPTSGRVSLDGLMNVILKVCASTTENCSVFSSAPAFICTVGKPPTETARSNDHLTSSAVTGEPSWNVASLRSLKIIDLPSAATSQLSASSGTTFA